MNQSVPYGLGAPLPLQALRIKHWPIDAHALVVPAANRFHRRHATEADADAARHRGFQRQMARDAAALGLHGEGVQHWFGAAAEEMLRGFMLCK